MPAMHSTYGAVSGSAQGRTAEEDEGGGGTAYPPHAQRAPGAHLTVFSRSRLLLSPSSRRQFIRSTLRTVDGEGQRAFGRAVVAAIPDLIRVNGTATAQVRERASAAALGFARGG